MLRAAYRINFKNWATLVLALQNMRQSKIQDGKAKAEAEARVDQAEQAYRTTRDELVSDMLGEGKSGDGTPGHSGT